MRHFLFIFLLFFSRNEASRRGWWTSPFPAECVEILEGVSTTASGLTDCILKNSFPQFTSCEFCHSYFTQMRKYYSRLENEKPTNSSKPCYDILSFGEKVNLIENVYSAATHLWRLPHCAACFDDDGEEMTMNNATLDFFALYADYIACQTRNQGNASAVCRECRKDYDTVNSYYDKQFTGNGAICMDVSNAWNRTRQDWNLEFSCRVIPRDLFLLGAFTVFFLLLPVIFYISMFLNSEYERVPEEKIEIQDQKAVYNGTFDAIRKIHRYEGVRGFYRGFWVNSLQVFSSVFYFSAYEGARHVMSTRLGIYHPTPRAFVGGLCASMAGRLVAVPSEVVSLQLMLVSGKSLPSKDKLNVARIEIPPEARKTKTGVFRAIVAEIYRRHGLLGFYRGYWISVGTFAPHSALWWSYYHFYNGLMSKTLPDFAPALLVQAISGPLAGMSASLFTNPLDVIRARVQAKGSGSTKDAVMKLWANEGWRMLTKGLSARLLQSGFFSVFMAVGYETVKRLSLKEEYKGTVPW